MEVVKKVWNNLIFRNLIIMVGIFFSFFILDVSLRYFSNQYVRFFEWMKSAPNLFSFSWIFLAIGILYLLPKKARMIMYPILVVLSNIIVYAEYLHFQVLKRFFTFSDLFLAGEGADYFEFAIGKTTPKILLVLFISLLTMGVTLFLIHKTEEIKKNKYYYIYLVLITIIISSGCRVIATYELGVKADSTTWAAAFNAKNIYIDYNNQNKSLEVSGIYELTFRSAYLYIKDTLFSNKKEMIKEIDEVLSSKDITQNKENKYTGILKDKNVIYILMESIDSWLVTEEVMPTLYNLMNEGINFTNRYAPSFGGGQTINSEFAMNTGLYAIGSGKAIYNYDKNNFKYSLANMLKDNGYSALSIHTNSGNYYNRNAFHKALGYEKHYGLDDIRKINHVDYNYYNDSSLVKNDEIYDLIVRKEPFFSFVISYSAHLPYDETNDLCITNPYNLNVKNNKELSCIRNLAKETDEMLRILLERLEEDKMLDNTALVLVTDHYTYGYNDQEFIEKYKGTDNTYLLQNVPLVIWSNDIKHEEVETIMDTADILPTLLNMLGISYNPNYYIGTDVFSDTHENFIYFSNDTFYDGNLLYSGGSVDEKEVDYVNNIISTINEKIRLNDKMIISNYFNKKES